MKDFQSQYSGPQIDEAVGRSFEIDMSTNGWVKLKSSEDDPYSLDYLFSMGNFTIFYFEGGTPEMDEVSPIKISVLRLNDILTQIVIIMDKVQSRQYIDEEWTAWETWYSTGYIYQQPDAPSSPMRNALWINTSDIALPVFYVYDGINWREVRPTDAMDRSVYDPQGKKTDVFAYIDQKIKELNQMPNGENTYADAFAVHIADNTIHLTGKEKKDLMDRPTKKELEDAIKDINNDMTQQLGNTSAAVLNKAVEIIEKIEKEAGDIRAHIDDATIHVDSTQVASWDNKADKGHEHILDGKVKVDCSALVSGTIPLSKIPPLALEQVEKVQNMEDMYKLTTDKVQNGDTVYVVSERKFFYVVNDQNLSDPDSYLWYAATLPVTMPWDQVVEKPTTRDGFGITDVYTMDETDRLIFDSDADTTDYLTTIFNRTKQMYAARWYYSIDKDPLGLPTADAANYSHMRVMGKDGNVYFLMRTLTSSGDDYCALVKMAPYESSRNTSAIDYTLPAKDKNEFELANELGIMDVEDTYLTEIDDAKAIRKYYEDTIFTVNVSFGSLSSLEIPEGCTHIYSSVDNVLYKINVDELTGDIIFTEALTGSIGVAFYASAGDGYTLAGIDPQNPTDFTRTYVTQVPTDVKFDGTFIGMELESGEYTGAFVLHDRTSLYFYPAIEAVEDQKVTIDFGKDYIIADTIERHGKVVALLIYAKDVESIQNPAWKAYQMSMKVAIIDPHTFQYVFKDITTIETINEVGSSVEDDYLESLTNIYTTIVYKNYPLCKGFRMIESNNAVIVYSIIAPLISLNLTTWTTMTTQWIDYDKAVVTPVEIHGEDLRFASSCGNDAILITKESEGNREWAFSVDNYNFYSFGLGYCWGQTPDSTTAQYNGFTTSIASNKNGIYVISTPYYHDSSSYGFECLQFKIHSITQSIDDAMDQINRTIEEETGIPTSKTEFYEFNKLMRAPVDITGGEAGYYSIFVDTAEPNPKTWHHIHYVNGDIEEAIPEISNMPSNSSVFYIKAGFMFNNSIYLILHLVNDDGSISVTIGTVLVDSIVLVSPTIAKIAYVDSENVQHIRYQVYKKNGFVYAYPNFMHDFTPPAFSGKSDFLIKNLAVMKIDCATSDFEVLVVPVPGTYHTARAVPDYQYMGVLHDKVFLFRMKRVHGLTNAVEITHWKQEDFVLAEPSVTIQTIQFGDISGCIPDRFGSIFLPFVIGDRIFFPVFTVSGSILDTSETKWLLKFYCLDLNRSVEFSVYDNIEITLPFIRTGTGMSSYDNEYQVVYDDETKSFYIIMKNPMKAIYVYRLVDEKALDTDSIIPVGEISEERLTEIGHGNAWEFDDAMPIHVNHTFMLMATSPILDNTDTRIGTFTGTPIIAFLRDNGAEIYKKSYVQTAQYRKKMSEFDEKFKTISENIAMARKYTNAILRILG